jgi:hypothetical protein
LLSVVLASIHHGIHPSLFSVCRHVPASLSVSLHATLGPYLVPYGVSPYSDMRICAQSDYLFFSSLFRPFADKKESLLSRVETSHGHELSTEAAVPAGHRALLNREPAERKTDAIIDL